MSRLVAVAGSAVIALSLLGAGCGGGSGPSTASTQQSSTTSPHVDRSPSSEWLGLNYNSSAGVGRTAFARLGVVYDRSGGLEATAGETIGNSRSLATGLRDSMNAGMVADVVVDSSQGPSGCTSNPDTSNLCLPDAPAQVSAYVRGFVATTTSIRRAYPHRKVIFEPMNEPWDWGAPPGTTSGRAAAREYAAVLAKLLPAARSAGVPLSRIYVPATGTLTDGTSWIDDLYRFEPCLAAVSGTCGPIEGWNVHPYGPPASTTTGVRLVPTLRASMRSGADNVIISEIGFCAIDVLAGSKCDQNTSAVDGTSAQTARWLSQTLAIAQRMHRDGWLRALIIWVRTGGGWSMQTPDGRLTAQGKVLTEFARSH